MVELLRGNWKLATRALADIGLPRGPIEDQRWLASQFRASMSPEVAVQYWEFMAGVDIRPHLSRVAAPALVIQRRDDRAVPLAASREVASMLPDARFVAIDGEASYAWLGDISYLSEVEAFLDAGPAPKLPVSASSVTRLSAREIEVLRLLAEGKTNQEIAAALVISTNTVAHHVTNILNKAALSNRTEAASYAHRQGIV